MVLRCVYPNIPYMRYRIVLTIFLAGMMASCQPVNRNKNIPSVAAVTVMAVPDTDSQNLNSLTLEKNIDR